MKNYQEIIKENESDFNDAEQLTNFLDNYVGFNDKKETPEDQLEEVKEQEDNINEYADGLVSVYYNDIVKEWQENGDCHELADEQGILGDEKDPYKIMQADLYCWYGQNLREDYNALIDLLDDQEAETETPETIN